MQGDLTSEILTSWGGIKQGCILPPLLFNEQLGTCLEDGGGHFPKLGSHLIPLLLYADDAVVLFCTQLGLKHPLTASAVYCDSNFLSVKFEKSNIMVFKTWSFLF